MSEWWSYRLSDLILFSPDVYYRTFALYHQRFWPAELVWLVILVLAMVAVANPARGPAARGRLVVLPFVAAWTWCAIAWHLGSYASINWAAPYFAGAFLVQALLLLWLGLRGGVQFDLAGVRLLIVAMAVIGLSAPLLGLLTAREWNQVEMFGVTPDPTAVATIAMLRLSNPRAARLALVIPVLWCVVGGFTLWALGSPEAVWTWLFAAIALAISMADRGRR